MPEQPSALFFAGARLCKNVIDTRCMGMVPVWKKRMAAKKEDFESFMSKVPDVPPLQGDEIQKQ